MYYQVYEWNHAFLSPARALNDAVRLYYKNPLNPLAHTEFGRQMAAAGDLFERMTRRYGKPEFGITETVIDGEPAKVFENTVWQRPFCKLVHFSCKVAGDLPHRSRVVVVAPMSGHYPTLLRGTVEALLPHHEVYITDWQDARMVPVAAGTFDLDDYIDYVIDITQHFEGDCHLIAVCQPAVPVFAATALLERRQSMFLPKSITLMGGPIDTRQNPTEVNLYAAKRDLEWFRHNVLMTVPFPYPGVMRRVYPGFLQLTGFMTMNLDRHVTAHYDYFDHLVSGDGDSADKHRDFYDEYLSVMDLTAEFYLQTVDTVFLRQALPKGEMTHRGYPVDPSMITRTPIFTVEGENDDISGLGQTEAAHTLAKNLPVERHAHYVQGGVGHYGVFNGSRFRKEIAPRITEFVNSWDDPAATPTIALATAEIAKAATAATEASLEAAEAAEAVATAADILETLAEETAGEVVPAAAADIAASANGTASAHVPPTAPQSVAETPPVTPASNANGKPVSMDAKAAAPVAPPPAKATPKPAPKPRAAKVAEAAPGVRKVAGRAAAKPAGSEAPAKSSSAPAKPPAPKAKGAAPLPPKAAAPAKAATRAKAAPAAKAKAAAPAKPKPAAPTKAKTAPAKSGPAPSRRKTRARKPTSPTND